MTNPAGYTKRSPSTRKRDDQPSVISGLGAVFFNAKDPGTEYQLWSDTVERIMPGAFDLQASTDVRSFFNHDPNQILGRTIANTLSLSLTSEGLVYEVTPGNSPNAQGVLEAVDRGDVSGSSFMFMPTSVTWREEKLADGWLYIREINAVELFEVGPVVFPAYESTTASTRSSLAQTHTRFAQWLEEHIAEARSSWSQRYGIDWNVARRGRELDLLLKLAQA